jgi:hypothetical protein
LPVLPFYAALRRMLPLLALALLQPLAQAQTPPFAAPKAAASAAKTVVAAVSKPTWAELNPMQQQSLKPLAASWNGISEGQKRKWLEVSKNYPNLPAADQAVMHSRMNEWVAMSPQQRAAARLNFAKTKELSKELTPDEKKAKWQTYQALSPEEKAKLAAKATPKPTGAATAVKPVEPQKLAVTPKGVPPLPPVPATAPIMTRTGDTLQNVVTPLPTK